MNGPDTFRHTKQTVLIVVTLLAVLAIPASSDELAGRSVYEALPPAPIPPIDCLKDATQVPAPRPAADSLTPNYLHTCATRVCDFRDADFIVIGVNWFGMETATYSPSGLSARNWHDILDQIAGLGYNTLRLPYTNEMLHATRTPTGINYEMNLDLQGLKAIEVLDRIIEGARQRDLRVILDHHWSTSTGPSPFWYTAEVSEQQWIEDWEMLARRYLSNDTVFAADLHNEPHGDSTWGSGNESTDWRMAAERAGNAVLEINPYMLIFVEGIYQYEGHLFWWGGNLRGVGENPINLNVPNRLVYSPHDYGPEVYEQSFFNDPNFPNNLPDIWDAHWGYIYDQAIAPLVIGEFGGLITTSDSRAIQWKESLLRYLAQHRIGFVNWPLSPQAFETEGVLAQDARTVLPLIQPIEGVPELRCRPSSVSAK